MKSDGLHIETIGTGEDVVLVHGWGMHSGFWREFARHLAASYRVSCIDLPGHGRSQMIEDFNLSSVVDKLMETVPRRAHWIGWSLGASMVLKMACMSPDRVQSATMIAGNPKFSNSVDWTVGLDISVLNEFHTNLKNDFEGTLLRFLKHQTHGMDRSNLVYKVMKMRLTECGIPRSDALACGVEILKTADLRGCMGNLRLPLMVILGAKDPLVPVGVATEMERLNPMAQIRVIAQAGHIPFVSHSAQILDYVQGFLNDIEYGDYAKN